MRRQVQDRGTRLGAPALWLVLGCCAFALVACGPSLSSEFASLDPPKLDPPKEGPPSRLSPSDAKPLSKAADKLTSGATPGNSGYKIGPLDVVEFSVFKVPELTRTAQVTD